MITRSQAIDKLFEISRLKEDWDSYGGAPPTIVAISLALDFICHHPISITSVDPLSDGGVMISYKRPGINERVKVFIGPNGDFAYVKTLTFYEENDVKREEIDNIIDELCREVKQ